MSDTEVIRSKLKQRTSGATWEQVAEPSSGPILGGLTADDSPDGGWSQWAEPSDPAGADKMLAAGRGAQRGALKGSGAYMGAELGVAATAPFAPAAGPFAPLVPIVGAVGGMILGGIAGENAADSLGFTPEEGDSGLKPYAIAGETFGESTMFGAGIGSLARRGIQTGYVMLDKILETARLGPKTFLANEAGMAASAGIAGGSAEFYGASEQQRAAAEIAGGFFNPSRLVIGGSRWAFGGLKNLGTSVFSKDVKLDKASKIIREAVLAANEDPVLVVKALKAQGIIPAGATSAQKSGSTAMTMIENALVKESAIFGEDSKRAAEESIAATKEMIAALRGTGKPEMLRAAAQMEQRHFKSLIAARIAVAENQAAAHAAIFKKDSPRGREEISRATTELVEQAMQQSRAVEKSLYEAVPQAEILQTQKSASLWREIQGLLTPGESLNREASAFFQRIAGKADAERVVYGADGEPLLNFTLSAPSKPATSGEMMRMRSIMLESARNSTANGKLGEARMYGQLAEGLLDDLDQMAGKPAYDSARNFSRELHDTFTRTFAGGILAKNAKGARRIPPELMLRTATGPGGDVTALRFKQLREAVSMLPKSKAAAGVDLSDLDAASNLPKMMALQEEAVRLSAHSILDPITGRVNPATAAKFLDKEASLLDDFPGVRDAVKMALKSEQARKGIERSLGVAEAAVDSRAAFSRLMQHSSPADAVQSALNTKEPAKELRRIAIMAKQKGAAESDGLLASVFDNAFRNAGSQGGAAGDLRGLDISRLYTQLFEPVRPGLPSVMQTMHGAGIINKKSVDQAQALFSEAAKIGRVMKTKGTQDMSANISEANLLYDVMVRMAGAETATGVSKALGMEAPSLIVAGAGSSAFRKLLEKIPDKNVIEILIKAAKDPDFAALLLERGHKTAQAKMKAGMQAHAYVIMAYPELAQGKELEQPNARN